MMRPGYRICGTCRGWGRLKDGKISVEKTDGKIQTSIIPTGKWRTCGGCMGAGVLPERRLETVKVEKERRKKC